jgi:hypothetical protein
METIAEFKNRLLCQLKQKEEMVSGRWCKLPHQRLAFIYQRQSTYEQKKKHIWSRKDQDDLVQLALRDGYPEELIHVEQRDLGISGGKTEKDRPGLAYLIQLAKQDSLESLWVVEVSRIYRDLSYVNADGLAILLREHGIIVCTPQQRYNLSNQEDWDNFHEEMIDVVKDTRYRAEKFSRARRAKAGCGFWPGTPVPSGYIVKKGNTDTYDLIELYPDHASIVEKVFDAYIKAQGSSLTAAHMLNGVEFPLFPENLKYMETRTSLRRAHRTATGYKITPSLIDSVVTNSFYIGWWIYGRELISEQHHIKIIDEQKFWRAYQMATAKGKPRGKAISYGPLPLTDLLWCASHELERKVSSHSSEGRYVCDYDYQQGLSANTCLDIEHRFLDEPIIEEVFRGLDKSGLLLDLQDEVIQKLRESIFQACLEQRRLRAKVRDLEQRIANYKWQLGETADPKRVETYWELITECQRKVGSAQEELAQAQRDELSKEDIISVIEFLRNIRQRWDDQPYRLQNELLRRLLRKVVIRHSREEIETVIYWKTGVEQRLWIKRPQVNSGKDKKWSSEEDRLLKELWPSMGKDVVMAAFPERSWTGISLRAHRLGLRRNRFRSVIPNEWRRWSSEEDKELAHGYQAGVSLDEIAQNLGRSKDAVESRASVKKLKRPPEARFKAEVEWEDLDERIARLAAQKFIPSKCFCWDRRQRG